MACGRELEGVNLGIGCGGPRVDWNIVDRPQRKTLICDALMDVAESHLWGMALNNDSKFFAGWSITVVAEKGERWIHLMGSSHWLGRSPLDVRFGSDWVRLL